MGSDRLLACGARWDSGDLILAVRVVPRAAADAVLPESEWLKVRLTAAPVDGKANQHLCKVLGRLFGVPKSQVVIDKGASGRVKRVRIIDPAKLPALLFE
jgi:hypothetical protein